MKLTGSTMTAWLVMFMDFFHYIAFMCTKPYLKSMLDDAGSHPTLTGVILALFSLIQVINALFLSKWIQKKGQKPQLIFGAFIYLIAGVLMAFAPIIGSLCGSIVEISLLALCVLMLGTSHGMFLICGHYVITGIPKEEGRDKYVGYLTFINSIGQFVGPFVAAWVLTDWFKSISFSGDYFFALLISVVASGLSLFLSCIIKNVKGGKTKEPAKVTAVLRDGPLMKIVFLNAAVYFATDVVTSYAQAFGEDTLFLTTAMATMITTCTKFSAIFVRAFLGWLSKLFGSGRLLKLSLLFVALSILGMGMTGFFSSLIHPLVYPFVTPEFEAWLAGMNVTLYEGIKIVLVMTFSLLFGLANGLVNPLALVELSNASNSSNRSPALALRNMCNSGGQTFGEVAFGAIATATASLSPIFLISGTVLVGCYIMSFDWKKKKITVTEVGEDKPADNEQK